MSFVTTHWFLLEHAHKDPDRAFREIVRRYQRPIFDFLRGRGCSPEDAEDLAQEVLTSICRKEFLEAIDQKKGKFRSLVLAVTSHKLASHLRKRFAQKRGGNAAWISIEETVGDQLPMEEVIAASREQTDEEFDRAWILNLVWDAGEKLQTENPKMGAVFLFFYEGSLSHEEISERLEMDRVEVGKLLTEARRRIRRYVRNSIQQYVRDQEEFNEEVALLLKKL